ncbi:MAG: hypothetical protein AAGC60_19570 [Acidobacteriota bacterium]
MSQFDVALGMDETTLDQGIAGVFANPDANQKIFHGSTSGERHGVKYKVKWSLHESPTIDLTPPSDAEWTASIDVDGKKQTGSPPLHTFQLLCDSFTGKLTLAGAPVKGTAKVAVFAQAAIHGDTLTITPLSVWVDATPTGWNEAYIVTAIKMVLRQMGEMLAGIDIPPLSFTDEGVTISLTDPVLAITEGSTPRLVLAASLVSKGSVDIVGVTWPDKSLFLLFSDDLVQNVVDQVQDQLVGQETKGSGTKDKVLAYDYTAKVTSFSARQQNADKAKLDASVGFGLDANITAAGVCPISAATSNM